MHVFSIASGVAWIVFFAVVAHAQQHDTVSLQSFSSSNYFLRGLQDEDTTVSPAPTTTPLPTCTAVGDEPFQSTVYTMIQYEGPNFDFNNITTLQQLETTYQAAYNSYQLCHDRYRNAFKTIGLTFVLSADLQRKQYLIGSRMQTNTKPTTCPGPGRVPRLYEDRNRTNTANDVTPEEDCMCYGPWNMTFMDTYNTLLHDLPVEETTIGVNQTVIGVQQLCVNANCTPGTTQITFSNSTDEGVRLPCNATARPTGQPTKRPSKKPTKKPTKRRTLVVGYMEMWNIGPALSRRIHTVCWIFFFFFSLSV